jgi:hypothetical protein
MRAMQDQLRINGSALISLQEQQAAVARRVEGLEGRGGTASTAGGDGGPASTLSVPNSFAAPDARS